MKKIICALLAATMLVALVVPTAFAVEKSAGLGEEKIIETVGALGIMRGDENGNLNLENKVTRAEFVKMAVCASNFKDDANVKTAYSVFPDVGASHWAAGYVRVAVNNGWINGYLDGTFRPSGNVKLEEAANIVLKLLGYTASDFVGSYPDGQLAKYRSLKLDTGISASQGAELSRRECMYLIYNMLCTYTKQGQAYCTTIGEKADAFGNIDYSALIADKKEGPYVVTDLSAWQSVAQVTDKTVFYKDGKTADSSAVSLYDVIYYSPEFSSVWIYSDKTAGVVESYYPDKNSPASVTVSGKTYTLADRADYSGALSDGSFAIDSAVVLLLGEDGCAVEGFAAGDAYLASSKSELLTGTEKLYVNDVYSEKNDITEKTLVYSCPALASSFAYSGNASGIILAFSPSKEAPQSITVSSKTHTLSSGIKELFKNENEYAKNDFVTVYFGKNGLVEYAEHADIYDTDIYEDNGLSYEALVAQTLKGPEIVTGDGWKEKLGFDADTAEYFADGKRVEKGNVRDYDVIYYSPTFKAVWIYSDKATGVIEAISPNAVAPTSVTVAGNTYTLETSKATLMFSGKGTFAVGDTVTLLLGAYGVAAAVPPESVSADFLGISTGVEKKEYTALDGKTYEDYYVNVSAFDGKTYSIKTADSDFPAGRLVYVSFSDGEMNVKEFTRKYSEADLSEVKAAIKAQKFTTDAVIVDYYGKSFVKTYLNRLSGINLAVKNLAYYNVNADGKIDYLVLKDATGDCHSYGVILRYKGNYNFLTTSKNSNISNYVTAPTGGVQIKYNNEADAIVSLSEIDVLNIDSGLVKTAARTYNLWDYAECFVMEQKAYTVSKESDEKLSDVITKTSVDYIKTLLSGNEYKILGYYDTTGVVRVLVAQKTK